MFWVARIVATLFPVLSCSAPQDEGGQESTLDSDLQAAIEGCRSAQDAVLRDPTSDRQQILAQGCASLFSFPLCSEAIRMSPAADPELRAPMIIVACQRAYCPLFEGDAEPTPELCSMRPESTDSEELMAPWSDFVSAVLQHELRLEPGSSDVLLFATVLVAVVAPPQPEPLRPGRALLVEIRRDGASYVISAGLYEGEAFGPWSLPLAPDVGDLTGLLEAAVRALEEGPAIIRTTAGMEYSVVVAVMNALRELGVSNVILEPFDSQRKR